MSYPFPPLERSVSLSSLRDPAAGSGLTLAQPLHFIRSPASQPDAMFIDLSFKNVAKDKIPKGPASLTQLDGFPALRIDRQTIFSEGGGFRVGNGYVVEDYGRGVARIFHNGALADTLSLYVSPPPGALKPPQSEGMSSSVYPEFTGAFPETRGSFYAIVSFRSSEIMSERTEYQVLVRVHLHPAVVEWVRLLGPGLNGVQEDQIKVPQRVFQTPAGTLLLENNAFWRLRPDGSNGADWADCPKTGEIVGFAAGRYVLIDRTDLPRTAIDVFDLMTRKTTPIFRKTLAGISSWYVSEATLESDYITMSTSPSPPGPEFAAVHLPDGQIYPSREADMPIGPYLLEARGGHAKLFDIKSGRLIQEFDTPKAKSN